MAEEELKKDYQILKKLFEKEKNNTTTEEYQNERQKRLTSWEKFSDKIRKGELELKDYANRVKDLNKNEDYLPHFVNKPDPYFGRSREGKADHYMIYQKKDKDNKYFLAKWGKNEKDKDNADPQNAEDYLEKHIKPLLKNILNACDAFENEDGENGTLRKLLEIENNIQKDNNEETSYIKFSNKQMLQKIITLELHNTKNSLANQMVYIYSEDVLNYLLDYLKITDQEIKDKINKEIFPGEEKEIKYYVTLKRYMIYERAIKNLNNNGENKENEYSTALSNALWKLYSLSFTIDANSPNVIYYGAPGTGKTYSVKTALKLLLGGDYDKRCKWVQFHPGYTYEDFIEGIKPVSINNGQVQLEVVNGIFKDFCIKAKEDQNNDYYFVVDEINRANLSAVFGETLTLLEPSYRDDPSSNERNLIETPLSPIIKKLRDDNNKDNNLIYNSEEVANNQSPSVKFGIPKNIRFIGTMNDVDKSIDSFDLALRRRFKWIRKDCDYNVLEDELMGGNFKSDEINDYIDRCQALNDFISKTCGLGKSYELGHSYFMRIKDECKNKKITEGTKKRLFNETIAPLLTEYLRGFNEEKEIENKLKQAENIFLSGKDNKSTESETTENE